MPRSRKLGAGVRILEVMTRLYPFNVGVIAKYRLPVAVGKDALLTVGYVYPALVIKGLRCPVPLWGFNPHIVRGREG